MARDQGVSLGTVHKALKSARFHPYKITLTQELHINDEIRRLRYGQWLVNVNEENYYFSKHILFSDECVLHNPNSTGTSTGRPKDDLLGRAGYRGDYLL